MDTKNIGKKVVETGDIADLVRETMTDGSVAYNVFIHHSDDGSHGMELGVMGGARQARALYNSLNKNIAWTMFTQQRVRFGRREME